MKEYLHPSNKIGREHIVALDGRVTDSDLECAMVTAEATLGELWRVGVRNAYMETPEEEDRVGERPKRPRLDTLSPNTSTKRTKSREITVEDRHSLDLEWCRGLRRRKGSMELPKLLP